MHELKFNGSLQAGKINTDESRIRTMYYLIEETKESTNFYYVQTEKWCLTLVFFYLSEVFEITGIPSLYRHWLRKGNKPTLIEWLGRHPRWWSRKIVYPAGTKIRVPEPRKVTYAFLRAVDYDSWGPRW